MSHAEFERVRLLIFVAGEDPVEPIARFVLEQQDLIVERGVQTARVTIGKRISDRVYLTFSRSLGTSINDQIVLLEYEESDRLSWILSRNEDQQTYALEFRVRHVF